MYVPDGDLASTELITRDVGRHAVLIGPFSRDGWHHPGPAMYYVFAPVYRLLGSSSTAMNAAALGANAAAVAAMAFLARRRGGTALMLLTLLGCALFMRSLGPDELRLAWNPYVTVLPYGVLVFLTWSLVCGERWALPAAVLVASFLAQTHIAYAPLGLPLLAAGAAGLLGVTVTSARRDRGGGDGDGGGSEGDRRMGLRGLLAPSAVAVAVAVVAWAGPVIDHLTEDPGNLVRAFRWFRDGGGASGEGPRGLAVGWRTVSAQFGVPPEWLTGSHGVTFLGEPPYVTRALVPVLLLLVVVAAVALVRRPLPGGRRLLAVWFGASVAGVIATGRTIGPVYAYRDGWAGVLAMVAAVLVAWTAWVGVDRRWNGAQDRVFIPVAVGALAVLAVVSSAAHLRAEVPNGVLSDRMRSVLPDTIDALPAGADPVLVDGSSGFFGLVYAPSIVLELERRGIDAVVPRDHTSVGDHRRHRGGPLRARLVVAEASTIPAFERDPDLRMIAYHGDLPLDEVLAREAAGRPLDGKDAVAVYLVEPAPPTGP